MNDYTGMVCRFADTILAHARDRYEAGPSPLFVDGLNVQTLESPTFFPCYGGTPDQEIVMSNFANQQIFLRILTGLSRLTGEERFRVEAETTTRFMFEHFQDEDGGMLYWGHHRYLDLRNHEIRGEKGDVHELKENYPFYDFLYEVDPKRTERLIKGIWNAHISDWSGLLFNRHGDYGAEFDPATTWNRPYSDPRELLPSSELSFICSASDFMVAAYTLFRRNGDQGARDWANRMLDRYVLGRFPDVKILPYNCTRKQPPRCKQQYPDHPNAFEHNLIDNKSLADSSAGRTSIAMLCEADKLIQAGYAAEGEKILDVFCDHLEGYARYAYDTGKKEMCPIVTDGTVLTGYKLAEDGYKGKKGTDQENWKADENYLLSYALAFRLSGRARLWETLRRLFAGIDLGDIGESPEGKTSLNRSSLNDDPRTILSLIELYRATINRDFLEAADIIVKNMLRNRYHDDSGLFTLDADHLVCPIESKEALSLLLLAAARENNFNSVPAWNGGGEYEWSHIGLVSGYSNYRDRLQRFVVRKL